MAHTRGSLGQQWRDPNLFLRLHAQGVVINEAQLAVHPVAEPVIGKHPKGYLRDSGLLHRLLRIADIEQLAAHPMLGRSWEGMVVDTLLRGFEHAGIEVSAHHYRTRGGAEIDLILEGAAGPLPVEIKMTQPSDRRALRALADFVTAHNCPFGLVINNDEKPRQLDERIFAIPAGSL